MDKEKYKEKNVPLRVKNIQYLVVKGSLLELNIFHGLYFHFDSLVSNRYNNPRQNLYFFNFKNYPNSRDKKRFTETTPCCKICETISHS